MSLFWRIFGLNAVVLGIATALLLWAPVTVSVPVLLTEAMILVGGLAVMLVANGTLLRWGLAPLDRLTRLMTTVDLLRFSLHPFDLSRLGLVFGVASAHGRVLVGMDGWRAELARPAALLWGRDIETDQRFERLQERYALPTYRRLRAFVEEWGPGDVERDLASAA